MSRTAVRDAQNASTMAGTGTVSSVTTIVRENAIAGRLNVNNFDLLRLIFASTVMLYHMGILTQAPQLRWLQDWVSGSFGLQGFFFVSGFLVTMSYEKSRGLVSYARKRLRRIAPAYVMVVVTAALLLVLMTRHSWVEYFSSPEWRSYVFWNLLLANFVAPDLPGVFENNYKQAVNGSLWTIKVEVAFYCMVPVVAWLTRRFDLWKVYAVLFVAAIGWRVGFDALGVISGSGFWSRLATQAPGQFSFFVAGAIAYQRTRLGLPAPPVWAATTGFAAYAMTDGILHELVAPFAVGAAVYWAAIEAPYLGRASRYGDCSYGIYLFHWPVIQVFIALGLFAVSPTYAACGVLLSVVALAVASWYVLEQRFLAGSGYVQTRAGEATTADHARHI